LISPGFDFASATNSCRLDTSSEGGTTTTARASPTSDTPAKSATGSNGKFLFSVPRMAWPELANSSV
jgi:hypothetical protein